MVGGYVSCIAFSMQSSEPQTCQVNQHSNSRVAGIPHVSTHMDITYNSVQCTCMSDSRLSSKASVSSISWFCLFSRPACRIKTICDLLRNAAIYARRSQTDLLSSSLLPQPLHSLLPSFFLNPRNLFILHLAKLCPG